jgi:hypothetical protein
MPVFEIRYAPHAWRLLNGGFCLYKPSNYGNFKTRISLIKKLVYGKS